MKMNFCTMFDSNYIDRGIALCNSLNNVTDNFTLYIFAFDQLSYEILKEMKLKNVIVIAESFILNDELLAIKKQRKWTEYCWTCTPVIIEYVLEKYELEECTYIDADMYFYQSPQILFDEIENAQCDISIIGHRFPKNIAEKTSIKQHGNYCVEFNTFYNNSNGNYILEWWKKKCFESCSMKLNDKSFGDQMYLNEWPKIFNGVYELKNPGAGVAPWNLSDYRLLKKTGNDIDLMYRKKEKCKLVFYHFQSLKIFKDNYVNIGVYNGLGRKDERLVDLLYNDYVSTLLQIRKFLQQKYSLTITLAEDRKKNNKWKYTGVRDLLVYFIVYIVTLKNGRKNNKKITDMEN